MKQPKVHSRQRMALDDRIFGIVNGTLLTLFFIILLYPMVYVVSASFSDPLAVKTGKMILFPVGFSVDGYELALRYKEIWTGYANTIFYTAVGTTMNLVVTLPCAYALARRDLKGRNFIMGIFLVTMYFGGGLIPTYINASKFGLVNNRLSMLVLGLVNVYNLIVSRTFFANSIPWELQEAGYLDGCSTFQLFTRVVLPLSAPIIVVMALYYGVGHWNQYFNAMIYLKDRSMYPLQVFLKEILTQSSISVDAMNESGFSAAEIEAMKAMGERADRLKYCIIVLSAGPMLAIYPWLQKFFNKGIMIGSIKG